MKVYCSNCNSANEVDSLDGGLARSSVIHCRNCDKKIKLQFCPHCGSFYSITFSYIKSGRYRYKCKKCQRDFAIEFKEEDNIIESKSYSEPSGYEPVKGDESLVLEQELAAKNINLNLSRKYPDSEASFTERTISKFTTDELFFAASESFTLQKIFLSFMAIVFFFALLKLYSLFASELAYSYKAKSYGGFIITLAPFFIGVAIYQIFASAISAITFEKVFHGKTISLISAVKFITSKAPSIFLINGVFLLCLNGLILLFCKIPVVGTVFFGFLFFPVYFLSVLISAITFIGMWFYPPVVAHREGSVFNSIKNFFIFIKKHNLSLLYMIPVILALSMLVITVLLLIHTFSFFISLSISELIMGKDLPSIFSAMHSSLIRLSELSILGSASLIFKELSPAINFSHSFSGVVIGVLMSFVSLFLFATGLSIISTVSSHIYLFMERGLSVDDKRKALVFVIFFFLLMFFLLLARFF